MKEIYDIVCIVILISQRKVKNNMYNNMYEDLYEDAIKEIKKQIEELKELRRTNPELAKKIARESLQKSGILDENGELAPPYNGQKVNDSDFTRGPRDRCYEDDER